MSPSTDSAATVRWTQSNRAALACCRLGAGLILAGVLTVAATHAAEFSSPDRDELRAGFDNPPPVAYPGGMLPLSPDSKVVRAALLRQQQFGIHDLTVSSVSMSGAYLSDAWKQANTASIAMAQSMGFEVASMTSPGFSHTGDSRVLPEEAMKKLVWTSTPIAGGKAFTGRLAAPPDNSGPFQNIPYFDESPWTLAMDKPFYRDVAVIAYRVTGSAAPLAMPTVTSSGGKLDAALLGRNDPRNPILLDSSQGTPWLQLDYATPQTIRSAVLTSPETRFEASIVAELSAQAGDGQFHSIGRFDLRSSAQVTLSFPAVQSATFRLTFSRLDAGIEPLVPQGGSDIAPLPPGVNPFGIKRPANILAVSAFALNADGQVNEFERKAGFFTFVNDYYALDTRPGAANAVVRKRDVLDLTSRLRPDGTLSWSPPAGQWQVIRFGYSLTGKINHPAPPDATGLEVDKLSATHMRHYLDRYLDATLPQGEARKAVTALFADSIESAPQNWTEDLLAQFRKRRGYDPHPFLPALTGVVIDGAAVTDRFLWDYRQTIADLIHENTYGVLQEAASARGLKTRVQALEQARHQLGDDFEMRRYADMPMGALWGSAPLVDYLRDFPNQVADQRGAASVAHVYGRRVIGAESGTTLSFPGAFSPRVNKQLVDLEFALGVNWLSRGAPGPQDLWAGYAPQWLRYLARSSWLLQQGAFVGDVAYYYGQDAPLVTQRARLFDAPLEYGFDYINTGALLSLATIMDGRLQTPSGMQYRVLQLGGSSGRLTVTVLRRLRDLVRAGLVVAGQPPSDTPSLSDARAEFERLRAQLWGADGRGCHLGLGRVFGTTAIAQVLAELNVAPDVTARPGKVGDDILFVHRRVSDGDFYYVMNRTDRAGPTELSFRQTDRAPELWRADTGERTPLAYRVESGRTIVTIELNAHDALFVMFRLPANAATRTVPIPIRTPLATLDDGWQVVFQPERGGPGQPVQLTSGSWSDNTDPAVRYYSGTATYSRAVELPPEAIEGAARVLLSLGDVQDIADVDINGTSVGVRWSPPYLFDLTPALRAGQNKLEIRVTNRAVNRMIGDRQPGAKPAGRPSFGAYNADASLRPSGILGPVAMYLERRPRS